MRASKTVVAIKKVVSLGDVDACQTMLGEARESGLVSRDDIQTLFGEAANKCSPALCDVFLVAGADINALDRLGRSALHKAIDNRSIAFTRYLLKKGASPNVRNERGQTPLHLAHLPHSIVQNPKEITLCSLLLERGAEVNALCDDLRTPLHNAVLDQNVDTARLLIAAGADPSFVVPPPNEGYLTPLQRALYDANVTMARFFIRECAVDLNEKTVSGRTLLQLSKNPVINSEIRARQTSLRVENALGDQKIEPTGRSRSSGGPVL